MKKHVIRMLAGRMSMALALAGCAIAAQAEQAVQAVPAARAAQVKAPPLPPGSDKVRVAAGVTPEEVTRQKRAHKHSKLEKKDFTRNDTLDVVTPKTTTDPAVK